MCPGNVGPGGTDSPLAESHLACKIGAMTGPDFSFEIAAFAKGARCIAGVDEVGRGPLAGPVTAAAVILNPDDIPPGLNDSKRLTAARRATLSEQIKSRAIWAIAHASVAEIDALNILQASHLAMTRALDALTQVPDLALIDGNRLPRDLPCAGQTIVKGDARSLSIAAASILAKVARDEILADLAREWPRYGWEKNAGYPSPQHLAALQSLGVTPHHRRSFGPVRKILCEEN